jgi:hypothetical protein
MLHPRHSASRNRAVGSTTGPLVATSTANPTATLHIALRHTGYQQQLLVLDIMADQPQKQACGNPNCTGGSGSSLLTCGRCRNESYCSRECQTASWPSHKGKCNRQNYHIKFYLCPDEITDPLVIRTLSCPATATFDELHQALQVAFQWYQ